MGTGYSNLGELEAGDLISTEIGFALFLRWYSSPTAFAENDAKWKVWSVVYCGGEEKHLYVGRTVERDGGAKICKYRVISRMAGAVDELE